MTRRIIFIIGFMLICNAATAQLTRWYSYSDYLNYYDTAYGSGHLNSYSTPAIIWNDTTGKIYDGYAGSVSNVQFISVGTSFAPRLNAWNDVTQFGSTIKVGPSDAFTIDSVRIYGYYNRVPTKPLVKDTIKLGFVNGNGTSTSNLPTVTLSPPHYGTVNPLDMLHDTVANRAKRNGTTGSVPYYQNFILTNTSLIDTLPSGIYRKTIALTTPFTVPAGSCAAASLTFKSGDNTYFAGDTIYNNLSSIRKYNLFVPLVSHATDGGGDVDWPTYNSLDSNVGYFKDGRAYASFSLGWLFRYVPTWAWWTSTTSSGASPLQYPVIDFHITCPTCRLSDTIVGSYTLCAGGTATQTHSFSGGTWSSSSTSVATIGSSTGTIFGVSSGTSIITYNNGGHMAIKTVTVNPAPSTLTILGASSLCPSSTITLSCATPGGVWSSTSPTIATIGSSGIVSGITPGVDTVKYIVSGTCGASVGVKLVTVNSLPAAGTVTGPDSICLGTSVTITSSISGGSWTSVLPSVASIGSLTGLLTGISSGIDTILYTITNACGSDVAIKSIFIKPLPIAGTITGVPVICVGTSHTFTASVAGGLWNTSLGNASTSILGSVTGVSVGVDTVKYTITNTCGSSSTFSVLSVIGIPDAGSVSGPDTLCIGATPSTVVSTVGGGIWSTISGNAIISSTGAIAGVLLGQDTVVYSVSNTCGTGQAKKAIYVSDCTSKVNDLDINEILVMPNPTKGTIKIKASSIIYDVKVTNIIGETLLRVTGNNTKNIDLDLSPYSQGVYLLQINGSLTIKTIKQ